MWDIPKLRDENTKRRILSRISFSDPDISSRITGIDINLIKMPKVIIETI